MNIIESPKIKGAILATLAALSLSISMSLAKGLNPEIPTSLVVFMRSSFGLMFFVPFLIKNRTKIVKTATLRLQILRVLVAICAMLCTYYTYRNLPIAFATSIGMTSALFVTVLSVIILKEHIGVKQWLLVVIGYIGVILVIMPTSFVMEIGIVTALLANMFAAIANILAKILSRKDSTLTLMLYSNVGVTIAAALVNTYTVGWYIPEMRDIQILLFTGFFGITTQFCYLTALKFSSPSFLAPFEYTRMIFAVLIGIVVFNEIPNLYVIIGSIIIIGSTYLLTYLEHNKKS